MEKSYFLGSILLILSLQRIQSLELSCKYSTGRCFEYRTSLWSDCFNCFISNIHLSNPSTELTVNSKENPKTMEEVLRVEITLSTLKYVPNKLAKIFPSMTHLYLQDNEGLQTLKTEYFKGMTNLLQLWFWNNSITEIDGNTFMEIPSLQVLGVQTNKITKIDKDAFKGLKELTTLFVFSNFFESLHKDTFKDNKKLSYIHISHGKLINIPYAIFSHLSLLTKLDLRSNTCIDKLFTTVDTDLEQVLLDQCDITNKNLLERKDKDLKTALIANEQNKSFLLKCKNDYINLEKHCTAQKTKFEEFEEKFCQKHTLDRRNGFQDNDKLIFN